MITGQRATLASLLFIAYCGIIVWLHGSDMYNRHFSDSGALVLFYNLARVGFMFAIGWLIYWAGWAALRLLSAAQLVQLPPSSRWILGFFAGTGVWHMLLFLVGMSGGYHFALAAAITVLAFFCSLPHLAQCLETAAASLAHFRRHAPFPHKAAALAFAAATALFIAAKVIYPGGWHDYFTHYFFFYTTVVERGSILPNEVWYHFFYSKGAGLYFLSMLLTDPLAPSLVAGAFVLTGALIVHALVRRVAGGYWPWAACILYLSLQVYIRGAGYGAWGHLPKLHELAAVSTLALLWCAITLPEQNAARGKLWLAAMLLTIASAVMLMLAMAFVYGIFFALLCLWWWRRGDKRLAGWMFTCAAFAGLNLLAHCAVNFALTGLPADYFIVSLWPYLDAQKLAHWGVLLETAVTHYDRTMNAAPPLPFHFGEMLQLVGRYVRFDLVYPLYALALVLTLARRRTSGNAAWPAIDLMCYALLASVVTVVALTAGRIEPTSFYRFTSFAFAPMLCLAFVFIGRLPLPARAALWLPALIVAVTLGAVYARYKAADLTATAANSWQFVSGGYSIDGAMSHQRGLPADAKAEGAIHPAARAAWEIAGRGTRIWTFNPYTYCMLPDCRMESYLSFRLSSHSGRVLFGKAEEAKQILKSEGLNYFLIPLDLVIRDPLPLSELFSPDHIAKNFGVRWTDGNNALLTWIGKDTAPISPQWLARYQQAVTESALIKAFPLQDMKRFFEAWDTNGGQALPAPPWLKR